MFRYKEHIGTADAINHIVDSTKEVLNEKKRSNNIALIALHLRSTFDKIRFESILSGLKDIHASRKSLILIKQYLSGGK